MTVLVYTKDALGGPVEIDEEFGQAVQALNTTLARGNQFTVMDGTDGHEAFYIPNITRIKEIN